MTYQYEAAIVKSHTPASRWTEMNILDLDGRTLMSEYRQILVQLSHTTLTEPVVLDLSLLHDELAGMTTTFATWLASLGNRSLPTKPGTITRNEVHVRFWDAWRTQLKINPSRMGSHPESNYSASEKRDLLLSGLDLDYLQLQQQTLVTVNGLLHLTSGSGHGLYVVDGAYQRDRTMVGLLDFSDVGNVEQVPLTSDMLYRPHPDNQYYQQAHLNLGRSLEGRYVLLSIGGYLHAYDDFYRLIGDGLLQLDFNSYPMIQRYYESKDLIDLNSLPVTQYENGWNLRSVDELLRSDDTIAALLDLPQSFAILIDAPDLYVDRIPLEKTQFAGTYINYHQPYLPLQCQRGKLKEYWWQEDYGQWVVRVDDNKVPNYQFETSSFEDQTMVTNQRLPARRFRYDRAYWLDIGRER